MSLLVRAPYCATLHNPSYSHNPIQSTVLIHIRASTAHAASPSCRRITTHCEFSAFRGLTNDDVIAVICKLPDKQCATDALPTNLLKDNVDVLAPFITELFNRSMTSGVFPSHFKAAFITPLLKKPNLDPSDGKSYRPISNLSVLSNQNHSL